MKVRFLFIFIVNCFIGFSQNEKPLRYNYGLGLESMVLMSETRNENLNYFSSSYSNGNLTTITFKNKFNLNKWYLSADCGYGIAFQKQLLVFSNPIDPIIDFEVSHILHQWQIQLALGREFTINKDLEIFFDLGTSISGNFKPSKPSGEKNDDFESEYYANEDHWNGENSSQNFDYSITNASNVNTSFDIRIGMIKELTKNSIQLGLKYSRQRLTYENFIEAHSSSYSAIANSRSKSSGFGVFLGYYF